MSFKPINLRYYLNGEEEQKLGVSEDGVMRIFGFKMDEVTGGWRKLHNEKLHSVY
jgi:hypothetical protein